MSSARFLIVNADDLGLSAGVNAGIFEAHERGIVTSTSLMVHRSAAAEAVQGAADHPRLAIGLHIDLGQWDYRDGGWVAADHRCDQEDAAAVAVECRAQLEAFQELVGREPTHLDSHQHVHSSEPTASVAEALAAEISVPLRGRQIRYEGGFYGQTGKGEQAPECIAPQRLAKLIRFLPSGWTEIGCHPGYGVGATESSYNCEREREIEALCSAEVGAELRGQRVRLRSFSDFPAGS
jgi:chitin disaccharide deacetylase